MHIINQYHKIEHLTKYPLERIESAGRNCYKSEENIKPGTAIHFVKMLRDKNHEAMLEFADMTVRLVTNRGVLIDLSRHRLTSMAVESTRYVKYNKEMFFIRPVWCSKMMIGSSHSLEQLCFDGYFSKTDLIFIENCNNAEIGYNSFLNMGWKAQQAKEILPNSLKTEIVIKANLREWRHIFKLRTSNKVHPQMKALFVDLLNDVKQRIPVIFDDINPK